MSGSITNVVLAGLGGQGVVKASDILAEAAFCAGLDVKKSEIHGLSRRGGSVTGDVRFGRRVLSPMVPPGEADFLVVLAEDQIEIHRRLLRPGGVLIAPDAIRPEILANRRSLNVALLAHLSRRLSLPAAAWHEAIARHFSPELAAVNRQVFDSARGEA